MLEVNSTPFLPQISADAICRHNSLSEISLKSESTQAVGVLRSDVHSFLWDICAPQGWILIYSIITVNYGRSCHLVKKVKVIRLLAGWVSGKEIPGGVDPEHACLDSF